MICYDRCDIAVLEYNINFLPYIDIEQKFKNMKKVKDCKFVKFARGGVFY